MRINSKWLRLALAAGLGACALWAEDAPLSPGSINVSLPADSPLSLLTIATGESRATARGAATLLDLHLALTLRNNGAARVRGVTLRVVSQESTPGGKGSVAYPSLNIKPGESFPARIEMQLLRPMGAGSGPLVQVSLDGVLFDDLTFYGPDRLDSRRTMTAWELEAQRDREYFRRVLAQGGPGALRQQMLASLARQNGSPRLEVKVTRGARSVTTAAAPGAHSARFAFVHLPGSPVSPLSGSALVAGDELRSPQVDVRNVSSKPVRYVEMGWLLGDEGGRTYAAGSLPSSSAGLVLAPGGTGRLEQDSSLRFSSAGQPLSIRQITGFVSQVEFADGSVWVPSRQSLAAAPAVAAASASAEEQRLSDLYRRKGLDALVDELKKF
jgi:hypothetical protein